uniref:PABC domain-containing protein n=1 Tax=Globodera pallida TaxID=36090 RepID=A0A183CHJ0_GLOPA
MEKTAPLKGIITKKLDELIAKCHNDGMDAMKQIISDIGIFDGAAYKLLVSFGQKLEEAVKQDKEMLKTAYQVKDKITPTMK